MIAQLRKLPIRHRPRPDELPGVSGPARLGRRTKILTKRLAAGDIAIIDHVDLDRVRSLTGARTVEIASEQEFKNAFPDCETGAMPPFGNLYDMPVYADPKLAENEEITFSAGTHRELVRMSWYDMVRLVNPLIAQLTHARSAVVAA